MDRATRLMISEFGADVLISKKPLATLTPLHRMMRRSRINKELRDFYPKEAAQYEYPSDGERARVCIVWDLPRRSSDPAMSLMRRALVSNHIDWAYVAHVWAVPQGQDHPPLRGELAAWRSHTLAGIAAANAEHVVLLGGPVTSLWWPDAKINRTAGSGYVWNVAGSGHYVYPSFHPLALHHDLPLEDWMRSFNRLGRGVHEGGVLRSLDLRCHGCDRDAQAYDMRGAGWCDMHFSVSKAANQEKKWNKETNQIHSNQQTLI